MNSFLKAQFHMFFPNKHLLVHIPKTGGTSLEHAICKKYLEQEEDNKIDLLSYEKYTVHGHFKKKVKGQGGHPHSFISDYDQHLAIYDYVKFTVLRNPFYQLISLYNQLRKNADIPSLDYFILGDKNLTMKNVYHYIDQYNSPILIMSYASTGCLSLIVIMKRKILYNSALGCRSTEIKDCGKRNIPARRFPLKLKSISKVVITSRLSFIISFFE